MLGETITYNDKRYIIVSELGNQVWLFDEEVAKTYEVNDEMFIVIDKEEVGEMEYDC